jgi:sugar/nucleoside kinase (ribokinase family)
LPPSIDVLGIGANSVDYVYRVPACPRPDSPAAKLPIVGHLVSCGGQTATTLCTCASMGLRTRYVGTTGSDDNGLRIRAEMTRRGVDVAHAPVRDAPNPFAVILLDEETGERLVLWSRAPGIRLQPADVDPGVVRDARLVHVDDADEEAAIRGARIARDAGIPVTSDIERVTGRTGELVSLVTVPIFAEHALEPLTGERDFERALRALRRTHGGLLCVTLGARGAMLLENDTLHFEPGIDVRCADTTGAGDIFRGAFIVALLRGDSPADVLAFANAAAAVSCTRIGAISSVPTIEETERLKRVR